MVSRKDIALALSLANLCLISVWNRLLYPSARFSMDYSPAAIEYTGAILNYILLAAIFIFLAYLYRRNADKTGMTKAGLLGVTAVVLFLPLNWIRLQSALRFQHLSLKAAFNHIGIAAGTIFICIIFITIIILLLRWQDRMLRILVTVVMILLPFSFLTIGQSIIQIIKDEPVTRFADRPPLPLMETSKPHNARVVIVIFDEMDKRIAFDGRASDAQLPEFDRLRRESCYANNAFPPGMHTIISMPALITGKLVKNVWPKNQQELLLDYDDGHEMVPWSSQPTIFSLAHELGFNTALVGRAIPYSRIIGGSLNQYFLPASTQSVNGPMSLFAAMRGQIMTIIGTLPFATRLDLPGKLKSKKEKETALKLAIASHESNLDNAKKAVVDDRFGLVFVHFDVPHQPWIYDRSKADYSWAGDRSYQDNLALADRTLGSLRREMETAGVWKGTNVLVTSDHWLRSSGVDRRVPFFLKLADQDGAAHFDKPFNTILCYNLINALLLQQVNSYPSLVSWLENNRTIGPSPYY